MRTHIFWLLGLLGLALAGCATSADVPAVLSQRVDSAVQHQAEQAQLYALPLLSTGKLKFNGPVTIQYGGTGNVASTTAAPRAKAAVAAGPGAVASEVRPAAGLPWWVFVLVGVGSVAVWEWLTSYLRPLTWWPLRH